ncbi:hypothetical protein KIW84_064803 [Lathyrus oleraceus]|uniref:Uncharacterized protein n=1 Tax=Pisum sativum TaxID=3888 RepID=A0A9D4WB95_PEA|nr:hypothetical protein KIW84_064803 [Pisum sativum]
MRYFQMILAHSFPGRPDAETLLSEEEIFLLFCASQSHPVACGNFLLYGLSSVAGSSEGIIHVGGIVTQIATALGHGETVEEPRSPFVADYTPTSLSPRITVLSNNLSSQSPDVRTQIVECRRETAKLRQEVADLTLQIGVSDLTHATEADFLYQEITNLR